jgi:hypothetical protein
MWFICMWGIIMSLKMDFNILWHVFATLMLSLEGCRLVVVSVGQGTWTGFQGEYGSLTLVGFDDDKLLVSSA